MEETYTNTATELKEIDEVSENSRDFKRILKEFEKLTAENEELRVQIKELTKKKIHYTQNDIQAEFEIRLIRVEAQCQTIFDKMFQPSMTNPKVPVLTTEGKRFVKKIRERSNDR